tara:strand:- start:60 stop:353 length:294 start_codon:yes stop_codon:yes gene_type:complete
MTFQEHNITPEEDKANFIANWKYEVRNKRNALIAETDWIHLPDVTVSDSYKAALLTYRQQLRDMPAQVDDYLSKFAYPDELVMQHWDGLSWPTKPSP